MFKIETVEPEMMKKYRLWLNLTQEQIAKEFGVASNTYARWERGEVKPESVELLTLAFESLLNRRMMSSAETNSETTFKNLFADLNEEINFYMNQVDVMQRIRVGKTNKQKI